MVASNSLAKYTEHKWASFSPRFWPALSTFLLKAIYLRFRVEVAPRIKPLALRWAFKPRIIASTKRGVYF
jgi:hypothetical protein